MHPSPRNSIHYHPPPPSSIHFHPPPPNSFQPPGSSLQHPQHCKNQNIARNWAISPNLGQKIQSYMFWLKIGTHGTLEVLIPNLGLDLESDSKIYIFRQIWAKKVKVVLFAWKLAHIISRRLIFRLTLVFWIFNSNSIFGQIWAVKTK